MVINAWNTCRWLCKLHSIVMEHPYWTVTSLPVIGGTLGTATYFTRKELRLMAQPRTLRFSLGVAGDNYVTKVLTSLSLKCCSNKSKQKLLHSNHQLGVLVQTGCHAWWSREPISDFVSLRCWSQIQNLPASASFIGDVRFPLPRGLWDIKKKN
jgi:hypothetical protein